MEDWNRTIGHFLEKYQIMFANSQKPFSTQTEVGLSNGVVPTPAANLKQIFFFDTEVIRLIPTAIKVNSYFMQPM